MFIPRKCFATMMTITEWICVALKGLNVGLLPITGRQSIRLMQLRDNKKKTWAVFLVLERQERWGFPDGPGVRWKPSEEGADTEADVPPRLSSKRGTRAGQRERPHSKPRRKPLAHLTTGWPSRGRANELRGPVSSTPTRAYLTWNYPVGSVLFTVLDRWTCRGNVSRVLPLASLIET